VQLRTLERPAEDSHLTHGGRGELCRLAGKLASLVKKPSRQFSVRVTDLDEIHKSLTQSNLRMKPPELDLNLRQGG